MVKRKNRDYGNMTMVEVFMKTMAAGKFKATCLKVMDEVQAKREPVILTKNGKPVAKLVPMEVEDDPLAVFRFGSGKIVGDVVSPIEELEDWGSLK
jgi:prevent-host-death family protein